MEKYSNPEVKVVHIEVSDIITTSLDTETPPQDESDGIWEYTL